ncbi:MAG TPA: hypothetical protein VIY48_01455 [Candidatus Paceibacterota bacterium]
MTATLASLFSSGYPLYGAPMAGLLKAITSLCNITMFNSQGGCSLSSSATTYTNVTSASQSFTKVYDAATSNILVIFAATSSRASGGSNTTFGINDGTTDRDMAVIQFNTANEHQLAIGGVLITTLEPKTYTFQLRAKGSGATAMTIDTNDTVTMLFLELPK